MEVRRVRLGAVVIAGVMAACGGAPEDVTAAPGGRGREAIVFPVQDPTNYGMDALLEGRLTKLGRCLYVRGSGGHVRILPIWPAGFSYELRDGGISIIDDDGRAVAQVGSRVSMGGGSLGESDAPLSAELKKRVGSCRGPYWLVGSM